MPWAIDVPDDAEDRLDQDGRQAHRRLVEQEQRSGAPSSARPDGQHLLLAAGQRAALLRDALAQPREEREHALEIGRRSPSRSVRAKAPSSRFSQHGHAREDPAALRRLGDAEPHDAIGGQRVDALAVEGDGAAPRPHGAEDRLERRGLAGAVGADQRDDLAPARRSARRPRARGCCRSRCGRRRARACALALPATSSCS